MSRARGWRPGYAEYRALLAATAFGVRLARTGTVPWRAVAADSLVLLVVLSILGEPG